VPLLFLPPVLTGQIGAIRAAGKSSGRDNRRW
jgi:hypothetical protein